MGERGMLGGTGLSALKVAVGMREGGAVAGGGRQGRESRKGVDGRRGHEEQQQHA